jgi:hypothetical protein
MKRPITLDTRRELTAAVSERYQAADRNGKKLILDEFTKVAGYHRKHAIRILTHAPTSEPKNRIVRRVYQDAAKEVLVVLWEVALKLAWRTIFVLKRNAGTQTPKTRRNNDELSRIHASFSR